MGGGAMTEGKTMAERLASLEAFKDLHEQRCDDRQRAMELEIKQVKDGVQSLTKGAWSVAAAVILQLFAIVAFFMAKALHLA
jgi:hypothetical protein